MRRLALAIFVCILAPAAARAVSDANYDPARQGCAPADFTYDKKDAPGHDTPGCETINVQTGPREDPDVVRFGIDHEREGIAPHSGSLKVGPAGQSAGDDSSRAATIHFDTGYAVTGPRTLSPGGPPEPKQVSEPGVTPSVSAENVAPAVPERPLEWSFYFGMDDNWIFGEHHSVNQDPQYGDNSDLVVGPVSGGGFHADTHPTERPEDNVDLSDRKRPLRAADAGFGFCNDGMCLTGQTEERTIYQGGDANAADRPAYVHSGNPADDDPDGNGCNFREPTANCQKYYDNQGRVYAPPGVTVYQDPSPAAPQRFGPKVFEYPLPSSHVGTEGARLFDQTIVDFRPKSLPSAAAGSGPIRVYAIGYNHLAADAESYGAYQKHLVDLAKDVLAKDLDAPANAKKVLVFPEDSALYALFIGKRGAPLRGLEPVLKQGGGNGSAAAVAGLFGAYQLQAAYYRAKFPEENMSEARLGLLALTDTLYRSFYETFREIAIGNGAWVVAAANIAPASITTDPAKVALLGDPEALDRACAEVPAPCAYEAATSDVYNQAFVFDPNGNLVPNPFSSPPTRVLDGAVKKTYLVPIEQGPLEQGKLGLDLSYGDLRQVRPVPIAGMNVGILISKPAWMLDELGRLEAYDTDVTFQPEAFSSWGSPVDDWSPDVLKQSNWSQVQKYAPFRYGVLSELTGNFFDLVFDAQNHVVGKATAKAPAAPRYIGQPNDVGWLAVSPWVTGDAPGDACGSGDLQQRRSCLAEVGRALAPASGDPRENGYENEKTFAVGTIDLAPPPPDPVRKAGALGASSRVDDGTGRARNPRSAAGPKQATYVVWQDDRTGIDQIRVARISRSGRVSESIAVAPNPSTRQIFPQVAVTPDERIWVVWQELDPVPTIQFSSSASWGEPFDSPTVLDDDERNAELWKPAIAAGPGNSLHIAWIALAAPEYGAAEHLLYARIVHGQPVIQGGTLDDEAFMTFDPLAEKLNNRWNPAIAVRGDTVAVAWTDFRNYSWDLFAAVSRDGGDSFMVAPPENLRVDDASRIDGKSPGLERLHNDPTVDIAGDGTVRVAWTDQAGRRAGCADCPEQRRPDTDIAFAILGPEATEFSSNVRIDDTGDGLKSEDRKGFSNQWRPSLAEDAATGRLYAVWQDHRDGNNDIYLSFSENDGESWNTNLRVDDTGDGSSNQYSPQIVADAAGKLSVVWQDDRDGLDHIYIARGALTN